MTNEEAIKFIEKQMIFPVIHTSWEIDHNDACYRAIEALEKQILKKPLRDGYHDFCPSCSYEITESNYGNDYCCACGQKLMWE